MTDSSKSNRISYLDSLKGFAIICVVLGHVVLGFIEAGTYPAFQNNSQWLRDAVYSFHMPLFFIISGYFFSLAYIKRSECEANARWDKLKWQIANLGILYVAFTLFMTVFKMLLSSFCAVPATFDSFLMSWRFPYQIHWYLYVLIILYLFFAITIRFFSNKWVSISFLVICVALGTLALPMDFEIKRLTLHTPFFLFGIIIQQKCFSTRWWMGAASIAISIVLKDSLHSFFLAFGLSLLFWKAFESIHQLDNRLFSICGRNCLEIFLLHTYFVTCFRTLMPMIGLGYYPVAVVLTTVLSTAIPIGVAIMLRKIGLHEWVFRPAYGIRDLIKK